jgi:hypothetical protein
MSAVFLLRSRAAAEFRAVALLFKYKAAGKRTGKQNTEKYESELPCFHWCKDSSITEGAAECLARIFQPGFFYVISAANYLNK